MLRSLVNSISAVIAIVLVGPAARAQSSTAPLKAVTTDGHPMRYLVSVPNGWTADRRWPAVIVITDAERRFEEATRTFAAARGNLPFVIVTPLVLSGGGTAQQHMSDFDYGNDAWARAGVDGNCKFDEDGLTAVLADVRKRYHTEDTFFIAGWEAGGHVVLWQALEHPERWRAVAAATPNFIGRCLSADAPRPDAATMGLPIRILHGSLDVAAWAPGQPLYSQWLRLDSLTRTRGFTNVHDVLAPGRGHGPLAEETFAFLRSMLTR